MSLLTLYRAGQMPNAPSETALRRQSKKKPTPKWIVKKSGKVYIDTTCSEWKEYLKDSLKYKKSAERVKKGKKKLPGGEKVPESFHGEYEKQIEEISQQSLIASYQKPIIANRRAELENEKRELEIKKELGELITYKFAEFLFFGYMDKISQELLRLPKKIEHQIINYAKEKDYKKIMITIMNEIETTIRETKRAQKEDVEKWQRNEIK